MNKLCTSIVILLTCCTGQAFADRGAFYIEGKFGGSRGDSGTFKGDAFAVSPDHFVENVYVWGGAIGYTYKPWAVPLRMEVEYLYRNHYPFSTSASGDMVPTGTTLKSHTNTQTILGNAYVDIPLSSMFAVFFGGGIGEAISTTETTVNVPTIGTFSGSDDSAGFSWMGTAGFSVIPVKWLFLSLSYRYSGLNDISSNSGAPLASTGFTDQEILFGVRVMIPDLYPGASKPRSAPSYMPPKSAPYPLDK